MEYEVESITDIRYEAEYKTIDGEMFIFDEYDYTYLKNGVEISSTTCCFSGEHTLKIGDMIVPDEEL